MDNYSYLYELFIDNLSVYKSTNLNFVFHEYLNFMKLNKKNMIIKKKLLDNMKHFDLFLEEIIFDSKLKIFKSDVQTYDLSSVSYLTKLLNETNSNNEVKKENTEQKVKITPNKNLPKVKVVNFNKVEKEIKQEEVKEEIEPKLDENKLEELEELILKLEEEKEKQEEILEKEKEIISNKEMEEREIKMKERSINDKRKEINNIFESDKRLYFNFKEIQELMEKYKKNPDLFKNSNYYSLSQNERRAKLLVDNNQNFEIPDLFLHKYPIFKFLDENNLIDNYTLFAYKLIYYSNYEKNTESRKYFGDDVYLLNKDDEKLFNENFTDEEKELIYKFSLELSNKIVDMEKVISKKLQSNTDKIFKSNTNYKQEYENISQSSESDNSDEDNNSINTESTKTTIDDNQDKDSVCSDSTNNTCQYK